MSITASPDTKQLNPLSLISSLNSKLLRGQSLSTLTIQNFGYEAASGQTYNSYFLHLTNPALAESPFASDLLYGIFLE